MSQSGQRTMKFERNSSGIATPVYQVKEALMNEELRRRKETGIESKSQALALEKEDRKGRSKNRESQHENDRSKSRKNIKCYHCQKLGHHKNQCRLLKREKSVEREKGKEDEHRDDVFVFYDGGLDSVLSHESDWIIDSGAVFHVTPHRRFFSSYTEGDFGRVRMGNGTTCNVIGKGEISLITDTGCTLVLKNVRHVPHMRANIISTGKLHDEGYHSHEGEGRWKLTRGNLIVSRGKKHNTLYLMHAKLKKIGVVNKVDESSDDQRRFEPVSAKGLQTLAQKQIPPEGKGVSAKGLQTLAQKQIPLEGKGVNAKGLQTLAQKQIPPEGKDEANNPGEVLECPFCKRKFRAEKTYNTMKTKMEFLLSGHCNRCQKMIADA